VIRILFLVILPINEAKLININIVYKEKALNEA